MADGSLPIVVSPEAFGRGSFDLTVVEGLTVRGALVEAVKAGLPVNLLDRTEIYIDGARLAREVALDRVLSAGELIHFVVEPLGGGGGGKDVGQILVSLAVLAVSSWIGGMALFASNQAMLVAKLVARTALQVGVLVGGAALVSSMGQRDTPARANDRYALQNASNQYRQWGTMPLALGEVVAAPDLAVKTFTQSEGDDVWLYGILGVHYGPCEVSEVKIGDTLVSTMGAGDFRMVQHLEPGPRTFQLYPNDVDQKDFQEELKATPGSATPLVRAASSDGSRFGFDFFLPAGLHFQKDDGRLIDATVSVALRYRPIDMTGVATGPWQNGPALSRRARSKDPMRITHWVSLPHGRYEFELTRNRPDDDNAKRQDRILLTAIKAVAFRKPVTDETLSLIEFAVRASAINQGGLAPITCRIKPKCPTWTGNSWGPAVATSNPAALARWLLTGPAPAKPLLPAQADLRLRAWSGLCEQYDWDCHVYLTETKTQAEVLQILERAGRAWLFWDGVQVAASPWVEKPAPRQLFTGANLRDHRWEIAYPDPVHALRVEFLNLEKGGEADELFVYADGYGEVADPANGIKAATLVEALRLDGQATPNRAFRDGRWALGSLKLQRRVDTWTADIEHLVSQYGDRVRLAWRRPVNGAEARVRCRRWSADGSAVIGLRLTQPVRMEAGQEYVADLRTKNGLHVSVPVETFAGETREIRFSDPRSPALCPQADDLIAFGVSERVSEDVEIVGIEPGENLTAVITGVRYVAPLLMAGESGPVPSLPSRLSGDRNANPPRPTLLGVQEDAHGVRVSFSMPTWRGAPISAFTVRWRGVSVAGETASWAPLPPLDGTARELMAPPLREAPIEGVEATKVEFEITAATVDGRVSPPLQVTVVKPVPGAPLASVWSVDAKGPDANGVSQPILIVRGEITDPNVAAVRIAWGLTVDGPWTEAYEGAPLTKALEIGNLTPGVEHFIAITHLSAQGVPSQFLVIGPRVPGQLVAGDATHLGGEPVQDILDKLRDTAALADQNRRAVGELGEVYGDTVSAAASAAAAAASEAATIQARAEAVLAAAASDQRASAADAAKLEAQAARAGAVSARNESVDAATDSNAAAAVSKQERQLATQARSGAEAASSASVDARNQSASFADAAGVSAAASADSSVTATTAKEAAVAAAVAAMPDVIAANLLTVSPGGAPATSPDLPSAQVSGGVFTSLVGANTVALFKAVVPWKSGEIYEITIDVEGLAGSTAPTATPYAVRLKSDYGVDSAATPYEFMSFASTAVGQTTRRVIRFGLDVSPPASSGAATIGITASADAAFVRFGALFNYGAVAERQSRLKFLSIRNVTAQLAAESSATASAASASSAAASETASEQKAAAANEAMLLAQTARGGAQAAETGAVAARDGAEGYAATASAASNLSSQYRDQSQAAAQASNIAAGIASTKADEAGANAQAANAQKLAAEAARDAADQKAQASVLAAAQAEAFAGDAGAWARASEGSAVRAEAQAAQGLTYLNQTVDARDGAVAASISSGTSAGQAASDRQLAEEARDDARTAAATSIEQTASASASAAAAKISADLVTQVRRGERANLIDNPSGAADFRSWIKEGSPASYVDDDRLAGRIFVVYGYMVSQVYPAEPGDQHSLGFVASPLGDGGHLKIQYMTPGGPVDALVVPVGPDGYDLRRRSSAPSMAPAGTTGFRVVVVAPTGGVLPVWAIKVNFGSVAADFSDDYSATVIQGQLNITAAVAAEAADRVGSARFSVTGGAGGDPFDISLLAGPDGSAASLTATRVRLRNIVNGQAINVLEVVGGKARFGGDVEIDGNLLLSGTLNGRRAIIPDTVTPMAATYAAGSVALNGTAPTQVQEVWVTTQGGPVVVEFNGLVNMRHDPAGSFDAIMEVRRSPNAGSGIQMLYMSVPALGGGNDSVLGMYPLKLIDRPAAGTWRYFVTVWSTANNMSIQEVRQRFMSALEYRTNS